MEFQRDVLTEETMMNIYLGIEQDLPEYVYYHSIYTEIILKMMLEIRDIQNGYGQQEKSHRLLQQWISKCPPHFQQLAEDQALHILQKMCVQYGCWRDVKQIILLLSCDERHSFFIKRTLQLMNDHLYTNQPNVAKWVPRPGSIQTSNNLYDYLATDYVERFLNIETAVPTSSMKQIHQTYKNIVKNKLSNNTNTSPLITPKKQKTNRSLQEEETSIIEKALLLSKRPAETIVEEEDEIEKEWLNIIQKIEPIDNAIVILDTPLSFQTKPENVNRIKTVCRFLYKISLPSRKRIFITTAPEPVWMNFMGKTLVEMIRIMVQYTEVNDNPTEKSFNQGIKHLLDTLIKSEIPLEEMEKMSWIILSNFSQQGYSVIHSGMTNLFLSHSILFQYIPNLIYVKTNSSLSQPHSQIPIPVISTIHPNCRSSLAIRTFWTECSPNLGISNNHWKQISKISKEPLIRQFTAFQNVVNIVSSNINLL